MYFKGVKVYNPDYPRRYAFGGRVKAYGDMTKKQIENDSINAILMPNELIIPVSHPKMKKKGALVNEVIKHLDESFNIRLPNT